MPADRRGGNAHGVQRRDLDWRRVHGRSIAAWRAPPCGRATLGAVSGHPLARPRWNGRGLRGRATRDRTTPGAESLRDTLRGDEDRARFLREGQLAASISHAHTVYIFGSEEVGGAPAITMELLSGGTLKIASRPRGRCLHPPPYRPCSTSSAASTRRRRRDSPPRHQAVELLRRRGRRRQGW